MRDATLLGGTSNSIGVLWSLQWEVVFSLLLPVYLYLVRRFATAATIVAIIGCWIGWSTNDQLLSYMPMFFFGALLAQYWERVRSSFALLAKPGATAHFLGVLLVILAASAMTSFFLIGRWLAGIGIDPRLATTPIVLAGIALITVVSIQWPPLSRVLSMRMMVFLGTISFSLYLVHRPIMIALAFAAGVGILPAILTILVSVAIAIGFYYAFGRPVHRRARRLNASIQRQDAQTAP